MMRIHTYPLRIKAASVRLSAHRQHGFSMVELIISVVIISLLTLTLTPVVINRVEEAKIAAAREDLKALAAAEERAALETGYYYRIYALNDGRGDGDNRTSAPPNMNNITDPNHIESIMDIPLMSAYGTPTKIFIKTTGTVSGSNLGSQDYMTNYTALWSQIDRDKGFSFGWKGPYINWTRDVNMNDWPDDPWGNDYIFFVMGGAIYPPQRNSSGTFDTDQSEQLQTSLSIRVGNSTQNYTANKVFDRPTFLSMGPDGLPGAGGSVTDEDGFGSGDDIYYSFGGL